MEPYQERVVAELADLATRTARLRVFLGGPQTLELPQAEHARLWLQLGLMLGLERVLQERIDAWSEPSVIGITHVAATDGQPERTIRQHNDGRTMLLGATT